MISFIIPAYNEEALIEETVTQLKNAAVELKLDHEIIVVDDDSSDRTAELAAACGAKVVHAKNRQIAATRNTGAKVAMGDIFIFVDADTLIPAETIRAALNALENGVVGGGATINFRGHVSTTARILAMTAQLGMKFAKLVGGCFMFMTRDAFEKAGGFDEKVYASEEIWLAMNLRRIGRFVVLSENVLTSGRKFRQYGLLELLVTALKMALRGPSVLTNRDGLDLWYKSERERKGLDDELQLKTAETTSTQGRPD